MSDRRTRIYNKTLTCLSGDARSLSSVAEAVNRWFQEKTLGDVVSQVEVLVAVSVLGKATLSVFEQNDIVWLQRIGAAQLHGNAETAVRSLGQAVDACGSGKHTTTAEYVAGYSTRQR
jgi:hypothetical protein